LGKTAPRDERRNPLAAALFFLIQTRWGGILTLAALLAGWQAASMLELVHPVYIPRITTIFRALGECMLSGELPEAYQISLFRMVTGFGISCLLGVACGLLIGYNRIAFNLTEPLIEFCRPTPVSAIIPIVILLFGIDNEMKIFIVAWASFWPILINTIDGVRGVSRTLVETARIFGATSWELFKGVIIHDASPHIVTGMRVSVAISLIVTVIAEMLAGNNGIGFFVLDAERTFRIPEMYAGVFSLAVVGYLVNRIFVWLESRVMAWHKGLTSKEAR
jgi:ABC-type nitrate/sulfonate/bicarbonate transport system permease component